MQYVSAISPTLAANLIVLKPICINAGLSRLERWNRAEKLGLTPPQSVKQLIESATGDKRVALNKSVWTNHAL
jgi:hypothetical protein